MRLKITIITILISISSSSLLAQDDFTTFFITPELRINFNEPPIEIRYRPLDYYAPWGIHRTEIMAGYEFWKGTVKVFSHTRLDNASSGGRKVRASTGVRIDYNTKATIAQRPLLINAQIRRFIPLNENTTHQYVFVQDNSYLLTNKFWPSLLGFMTATRSADTDWGSPSWWIGPGFVYHFNKNLNTYICFLPDILGGKKPYVFLRLQYKVRQ